MNIQHDNPLKSRNPALSGLQTIQTLNIALDEIQENKKESEEE